MVTPINGFQNKVKVRTPPKALDQPQQTPYFSPGSGLLPTLRRIDHDTSSTNKHLIRTQSTQGSRS